MAVAAVTTENGGERARERRASETGWGKEQVEWVVQVEAGIEEARRRKPYPLARAMPARRVRRGRARSASPGRRNRRRGESDRKGGVGRLGWADGQLGLSLRP